MVFGSVNGIFFLQWLAATSITCRTRPPSDENGRRGLINRTGQGGAETATARGRRIYCEENFGIFSAKPLKHFNRSSSSLT
jgi:hypothetical protein